MVAAAFRLETCSTYIAWKSLECLVVHSPLLPCLLFLSSPTHNQPKMGYTLAVLGCGTMGIAILSGVLSSLDARLASPHPNGSAKEPASGISTPTASMFLDAPDETLPARFIATVGREETGRKLKKTFAAMGRTGEKVEVLAGVGNVGAVKEADVIIVWYVYGLPVSIIRESA